ncbi:hypothetical protein PLESTF_000112700 [Pleodorina starrii]|nr:hypothetical protein PLESTM_001278500 [Pleodorina starrii]GLC64049.1 hypothetical protein PLESTF_000112700 [Pleodorina starrii]
MAAGTPDEKFQKLREENERRRKKKEEEEKRRKQEEDQKAKEALERRRMERLEQDERMRKPWQQPPAPKKPILKKGAKQKPVQPAPPACDPVRQSQAEEKRREWRQGLQDFIKQQRQQAVAAVKAPAGAAAGPAGGGAGQDGAPVVPLTWEELRMAAEAGFDELLKQKELQAEQNPPEEPTSRIARHRSPYKSPFRGAPAPPQETVQVALVPTQQYNGNGVSAPPAQTQASPRHVPDHRGGGGAAAAATNAVTAGTAGRESYKYSDAPSWVGTPGSGPGASSASGWQCQQQQLPTPGAVSIGSGEPVHANFASDRQQPQQHSADAATGDSGVEGPPAAILYPPAAANAPDRGSWADGLAGLTGDAHAADGGSSVGGSGAAAVGSIASSGGLRRGVTSTARYRTVPLDPSSLDLAASSAGAEADPWVEAAPPTPSFGYPGDSAAAPRGSPRGSPRGQRPPLPGPYDAPSQQQWPPVAAAETRAPTQQARAVPAAPARLGIPDDPLEASLQADGTLAALQQADGFRLSSPRSAGQLPPPPQQQQQAPQPQSMLTTRSQDCHPGAQPWNAAAAAASPVPVPQQLQQHPARQDQRHARRGWGVPAQPPAAATADPQAEPPPPPWALDGTDAATATAAAGVPVAASWGPDGAPSPDSGVAVGRWAAEDASPSQAALLSSGGQGQARSPAAIRHSVAVGDSGGPAMWQRDSVALHHAVPPPMPPAAAAMAASTAAPLYGMAAPQQGVGAAAVVEPPTLAPAPSPPSQPRPAAAVQGSADSGGAERRQSLSLTQGAAGQASWPQGQSQAPGAAGGRVDMSADLVRFSSPPGPSRAPSDTASPAVSPPQPVQSSLEVQQQQPGREQQTLLQQGRQSRHLLSGGSCDGEAPTEPSLAAAASQPAGTGEADPWVGQAQAPTVQSQAAKPATVLGGRMVGGQPPAAPELARESRQESWTGLRDGVTASQQPQQQAQGSAHAPTPSSDAPEPGPGLRLTVSQPHPQPQGSQLPPVAPGRPLSASAARLSSPSGVLASPPVSLPPLSPQAQQVVPPGEGDGAAAAPQPQPQAHPPQQAQVAPFRAPSPPASPPRTSGGPSQRFHRQHSATSLLDAVSLTGSAGGGSAPPARPYCDGQGLGVAASDAPAGHAPPAPMPAQPQPPEAQWQEPPVQPLAAFADLQPPQPQPQVLRPQQLYTDVTTQPSLEAAQAAAAAAAPVSSRRPGHISATPASSSPIAPAKRPATRAEEAAADAQPEMEVEGGLEVDGEVDLEEEEEEKEPAAGRGVSGGVSGQISQVELDMEESLERPPGTAEGSVLTGSHISARPWSGPSTCTGGGGSRLAGSGYQTSLLEDSVSSFDFRSRSAAASRPVSASPSCAPLPPPTAGAGAASPMRAASPVRAASPISLLYPAAAAAAAAALKQPSASRPTSAATAAAAAGSSVGKSSANGPPVLGGAGIAAAIDVRQGPHPSEGANLPRRQEPVPRELGWTRTPARPGVVVTHGSAATPSQAPRSGPSVVGSGVAAGAPNSFQVLQRPAGGGDGGANLYGSGDDVDGACGDGQPFVEESVDEPVDERYCTAPAAAGPALPADAPSCATTAPPAPASPPAPAAAGANPDPDLDALMREIQELSALRKALKAEFEVMGHGEAVANLRTLSTNFTEPTAAAGANGAEPPPPPPVQLPQAAAAAPLLQWNLPRQPAAQAPTADMAVAPVAAIGPAGPLGATAAGPPTYSQQPHQLPLQPQPLPNPVSAAQHLHLQHTQQQQPQHQQQEQPPPQHHLLQPQPRSEQPFLVNQQQHQQQQAEARWLPAPQLPVPTSAMAPAGAAASEPPPPPLPPTLGPLGPLAFPTQPQVTMMASGPEPGHAQAEAQALPGGWGPMAPAAANGAAAAAAADAPEDSQCGSFAFAAPAAAAGLAAPLPVAPPVIPVAAPEAVAAPAQAALTWTIPVNGGGGGAAGAPAAPHGGARGAAGGSSSGGASASGSATSTPRKAAAAAPQPKKSPSGGGYGTPTGAVLDSPGPGPGSGTRRGSGTTVHVAGGTASIGRQASANAAAVVAATPAERPLINEGSYAQAAVQARERAERERAAREVLQAESAAAKAAAMQRSRSERASGGPAAAASPSAAGGSVAKEASPLGPKAPSTIGSYVRQPSPVRAVPAARSAADAGDSVASVPTPGSEAQGSSSVAAGAKQAWGTPSSTARPSRIPTPPRARDAPAAAVVAPAAPTATPPPPPPRPAREDSSDSDFDFLERASDVSDSETPSPEPYGVSSKASLPPPPPRREAFVSPSAAAAAASAAYQERLADARPQPLRIPSSVAATPMGGVSTASTAASRAVPTGGRGHGGAAAAVGASRHGGRGPSTPFTAAIRELMGLPGSAPLEQSRAAAGKQLQQQQQQRGNAAAAGAGAGVEPIRLLSEEEDKLLASLKRLDADILRRGLAAAGIINDPQVQPAAAIQQGGALPAAAAPGPAAKGAAGGGGKAVRGAGKGAAAARAGAAAASPLTNSFQQDQLRESLERLDVRLGALRRKMEDRACSLGTPSSVAATPTAAATAAAAPRPDATPPRDERRGPPATLAKSRTPTPNKAKAIRDQRQQQLSTGQGPTPPPARAPPAAAAQPPKPASAPTMGTLGASAAAEPPMHPPQLQPAAAAAAAGGAIAAGAQPHGMPPRAPPARAPASAPSGPAAANAALQQQQQQQQQQQYQQQMMAAGGMPYGMMPGGGVPFGPGGGGMMPGMMFAPPPQGNGNGPLPMQLPPPPPPLQQQQPAAAAGCGQQVAYVPAMLPNGQMAYVPQYVQAGSAAGGFPGFLPFSQADAMQQQQQQPHPGMVPPPPSMMMMMTGQGHGQGGHMPAGFPGGPMQQQQQQQPGVGGPMLAWGAAPPPPPQHQQQQQQQQQPPLQQRVSYSGGGGGGPSLYSFDRSGHGSGYGSGPHDASQGGGMPGGYGPAQPQQLQQLPYATGPQPSGPMPHYHSTVMRSRSIGSRDGEVVAAAAAAAGLINHQHHQHQQQYHQHAQTHQQQSQQPHTVQGPGHPYSDQQGGVRQEAREPYSQQQQGQGSSQPHQVQVQSFGPNGSSRGLGAPGGWGLGTGGAGGSGASGGADAGVIKAVNLGLLLS